MDPNVTLREALQALSDYRTSKSVDDLLSARIRFEALTDWLYREGFPPVVTKHPRASGSILFQIGA